jgi:hypothetical protein
MALSTYDLAAAEATDWKKPSGFVGNFWVRPPGVGGERGRFRRCH